MHIGELARNAGVNIQTIRFYEREGLLRKPPRSASGYRCYEQSDREQVSFIRRSQELGFTLAEIKQLTGLHRAVAALPKPLRRKPGEIQSMVEIGCERLRSIEEKLRSLRAMRRQLTWFLEKLRAATVATCPASPGQRTPRKKSLQKSA
jgi:DNA-binding transcriptional MerR regulator